MAKASFNMLDEPRPRGRVTDVILTMVEMYHLVTKSKKVPKIRPDELANIASLIDRQAEQRPDAVMIVTANGEVSWDDFRKLANRFSNMLVAQGIKPGDAVAVNMVNDIRQLAAIVGTVRIGAIAGLLNTNISGAQLIHCAREVDLVASLVDTNGLGKVGGCVAQYQLAARTGAPILAFGVNPGALPAWALDGDALLSAAPEELVARSTTLAGAPALYIYTSGTTDFPKAAIITHGKFINGAAAIATIGYRSKHSDRLYNCLPLYHGTGLMLGAGACLFAGNSMFLAQKFSASQMIAEANRHHCNQFIYVGELCRYLLNTPPSPGDASCSIKVAIGNGLRPDIFRKFRRRFRIKRVLEFYSGSEANGGFTNLLNKDNTIGLTGNVIKLVRWTESGEAAREGGRVSEVAKGEDGLLLIKVTDEDRFEGYRNAAASRDKLERDAFEFGDCWYNSGDLIKEVDVGFAFGLPHYQFVDRLGDTFRWKSENVSTNEVAEIISGFDQVEAAVVYGVPVPGADGKAGMTTIVPSVIREDFDVAAFHAFASARLPSYAMPVFVRLTRKLDTTSTHKFVKTELVSEGFAHVSNNDPVFALDNRGARYVPWMPVT